MALRLRLSMLFLLVLPAALSAQERTPRRGPRPSVGGEVGYSRSDLGGPDAQRVRSRQGALTGVYIQVPLTGPLSIRPEILFALKGGRVQADCGGWRHGGARHRSRLPRAAGAAAGGPAARAVPSRRVRRPGPLAPDRLRRSDRGSQHPGPGYLQETDLPAFRQFDVGLVAGGGLEVRWPQSALALEARYTTGLRSVLNDVDVRNRSFGIVLSLTF